MKSDTAKLFVILGTGTAVVGTTVKEILDGQRGPSFYVPLAGAMVAIPLLIASDLQPDIAGGLAVLIFMTALTYSGESIMRAITNATGSVKTVSGGPLPTVKGRTSNGPVAS